MVFYYDRAILYFDGASRHNPQGPAGCGFVLTAMDENGAEGQDIFEGKEYLGYDVSNNEAEYHGLLSALNLMDNYLIEVRQLYVRGDSELVINQINGDYQVRSPRLMGLYNQVMQHLEHDFQGYRVSHIPRHKNYRADQLANEAIDDEQTWDDLGSR